MRGSLRTGLPFTERFPCAGGIMVIAILRWGPGQALFHELIPIILLYPSGQICEAVTDAIPICTDEQVKAQKC